METRIARHSTRKYDFNALKFQADFDPKYRRGQMRYTIPRSDAGIIVTEHGVADLRGEPLSGRVRKMIAIAHPAHREALERQAAMSGLAVA